MNETFLMLATSAMFVMYAMFIVVMLASVVLYYLGYRINRRKTQVLKPDGAIPNHIIQVGTMNLAILTEALLLPFYLPDPWSERIAVFNVVLFAFGNFAVIKITRYELRRYRTLRPRPQLPLDQ